MPGGCKKGMDMEYFNSRFAICRLSATHCPGQPAFRGVRLIPRLRPHPAPSRNLSLNHVSPGPVPLPRDPDNLLQRLAGTVNLKRFQAHRRKRVAGHSVDHQLHVHLVLRQVEKVKVGKDRSEDFGSNSVSSGPTRKMRIVRKTTSGCHQFFREECPFCYNCSNIMIIKGITLFP